MKVIRGDVVPVACVLLLVQCCSLVNCLETQINKVFDPDWRDFKQTFHRQYADAAEETARRLIFDANMHLIETHNIARHKGVYSFEIGINQFTDMRIEEVVGSKGTQPSPNHHPTLSSAVGVSDLPPSVDWRQQGFVTPPKDQGAVGAAWAFAATGAVEGQFFNQTKQLVSFSERQLVDCTPPMSSKNINQNHQQGGEGGGDGCGWVERAFESVLRVGGLMTEADYPSDGPPGQCRFKDGNDTIIARLARYDVVSEAGSEAALQQAVATVGPLAVAVDVTTSFTMYTNGIFDDSSCGQDGVVNHNLLLVGYGVEDSRPFWVLKNSWGVGWGEAGYIRIARNANNLCRVADCATYPVMA